MINASQLCLEFASKIRQLDAKLIDAQAAYDRLYLEAKASFRRLVELETENKMLRTKLERAAQHGWTV